MLMSEQEGKSGFLPVEWSDDLVGDFKREIFDVYFQDEFSVSQWKKVLFNKKRPAGMQSCRVAYDNQMRKLKLNNAELGRLCHVLQMSCSQFNSVFATSINASNIPSSYAAFCKQSDNDRKSNIYRQCKEILERHGVVLIPPKMKRDDAEWERSRLFKRLDEADEADRELIEQARLRMAKRDVLRENAERQFDLLVHAIEKKNEVKSESSTKNATAKKSSETTKEKPSEKILQPTLFG